MTVATKFDDPKVQALWEKHKCLVWWAANRCFQVFGGRTNDYIGTLTIRFAEAATTWEECKGSKFSSYMLYHFLQYVMDKFLRYERESNDMREAHRYATDEAKKQQQVEYNTEIGDFWLYRVPDKDDEIAEIVDSFDTIVECWNFFTRGIKYRDRLILEERFRSGRTLEDIGIQFGISKERVRQIEQRALNRIRNRIRLITRFTELFSKRMDEH